MKRCLWNKRMVRKIAVENIDGSSYLAEGEQIQNEDVKTLSTSDHGGHQADKDSPGYGTPTSASGDFGSLDMHKLSTSFMDAEIPASQETPFQDLYDPDEEDANPPVTLTEEPKEQVEQQSAAEAPQEPVAVDFGEYDESFFSTDIDVQEWEYTDGEHDHMNWPQSEVSETEEEDGGESGKD